MIVETVLLALVTADPALAALFTPIQPVLGRYDVVVTAEPIDRVKQPDAAIDVVDPLDALGFAGPYDRGAVSRLYASRRARVVREWQREGSTFVAITLISPYPDAALTRLVEGTMAIRFILPSP